MRHDMQKLLCERERHGSSERSAKTRLRLNPNLDYESDDYDSGPSFVSSARRRQGGAGWDDYKQRDRNYRPLYQFLHTCVGRPWDEVYSEIRQHVDHRSHNGYELLREIEWMVHHDVFDHEGVPYRYRWSGCVHDGFWVDKDSGLLCYREYQRHTPPPRPAESLHWYDNVWFRLDTIRRSKCGCNLSVGFNGYRWYMDKTECPHHNPLIERKIWYVVEYGYHHPDEIYSQYRDTRLGSYGELHTVYYRDVPHKLKEPFEIRKKVANRKELKLIQTALAA